MSIDFMFITRGPEFNNTLRTVLGNLLFLNVFIPTCLLFFQLILVNVGMSGTKSINEYKKPWEKVCVWFHLHSPNLPSYSLLNNFTRCFILDGLVLYSVNCFPNNV